MIKVLMGYNPAPGVSRAEHDHWLKNVHLKDMALVPGLEKVILNHAQRVVMGGEAPEFLAELHYPDMDTYRAARDWLKKNPFPLESQPQGRLDIKFLIVCDSETLRFSPS